MALSGLLVSVATGPMMSMQGGHNEGLLQIASPRSLASTPPPSTPNHGPPQTPSSQSDYGTPKHSQSQGSFHSECPAADRLFAPWLQCFPVLLSGELTALSVLGSSLLLIYCTLNIVMEHCIRAKNFMLWVCE